MTLCEKLIFTTIASLCLTSLSNSAPTNPAHVTSLLDCEAPMVHRLRVLGELKIRVDNAFSEMHRIYGVTPIIRGIVFFEDREDVEDIMGVIYYKLKNFHFCFTSLKSLNISQENHFKNEDVERRMRIFEEIHSAFDQVKNFFFKYTENDTPAYCHGLNHTEIDFTLASKYDKSFFGQLQDFLSESICQWDSHDDYQAHRNCDVSKNAVLSAKC